MGQTPKVADLSRRPLSPSAPPRHASPSSANKTALTSQLDARTAHLPTETIKGQTSVAAFCATVLGMGVEWTPSADKHGIPREDALYAMMHYAVSTEIEGDPGERTVVYVGHPHGQTDRYLEVIAAHIPPRTILIFHVMPLTDMFRYLLHEGEQP